MQSNLKGRSVAFLSILAAFMWGFNYPGVKILISHLPPLFTVGFRFLMMGLFLLPFLIHDTRPPKQDFLKIIILSILIYSIPIAMQGLAFQWLDASIVALSSQLDPIVMTFMGAIFYKESLRLFQMLGLLLSFIGIYFVLKSPEIDMTDYKTTFCLGVPILSWAGGMIFSRQIKLAGVTITGYSMIIASVPILMSSYLFESQQMISIINFPGHLWILFMIMCIFSISANCIYTYLIKNVEVGEAVPYLLTLPIFSIIASFFLLDEILDPQAMFGGFLILIGVLLSTTKIKVGTISRLFASK